MHFYCRQLLYIFIFLSAAKQRAILVEWLNSIQPDLALPIHASDEVLRSALVDGTVFCSILKRLRPTAANQVNKILIYTRGIGIKIGIYLMKMIKYAVCFHLF